MKPRPAHVVLLPLVMMVVMAACGDQHGAGAPRSEPREDVSLEGGTWVLATGSVDGEPLEIPDGHRASLTVDGDQVGGTSACNEYGGRISIDGDHVAIAELGGTDMACAPAAMAVEQTFLAALGRVSTASRDGDTLELVGPDVSLTFELQPPVPESDVVGTTWELDSLVDGDAVSSVSGKRASLLLRDDGTFTGSSGCRELTGRYIVHGDEIVATDLEAHGDCPERLWDQDGHVVTVLGDGFRIAVQGRRLTLSDDDQLGLIYVAPR